MGRVKAKAKRVETPKDLEPQMVRRSGPNKQGQMIMLLVPTPNTNDFVMLDTIPGIKDKFDKHFERIQYGTRWYERMNMVKMGAHDEITKLVEKIGAASTLAHKTDTYTRLGQPSSLLP